MRRDSASLPVNISEVGPKRASATRSCSWHLPLRVRKVFRGVWVPFPAHLSYRTNQLGLRRAEKNNALDVSVDEMVVVVLLENPCSKVAEDVVSLLVRECT